MAGFASGRLGAIWVLMGTPRVAARYPPNFLLRQARLRAGSSQDEFADRLGAFMRERQNVNVSPSGNLVGMWERGEARPGRHYRQGLTAFTGISEAELGLAPPPYITGDAHSVHEEDDTKRREMISSVVAAGVALSGFPLAARGDVPDRISPEDVAEVRRLTGMYRASIYQHGADAQLQRGVARLLGRATSLLDRVPEQRVRLDLLDAAADCAGLAAYACRDLGQHDWAQQYYLLAMQAAQSAGDQALAGHLVVRMAGHNIELIKPDEVLSYLDAANRAARAAFSDGELSNQHAIGAWAHAQAGNVLEVHRETGLAEELFAAADRSSVPDWQAAHVAEAELYSLTGAGYTALARHDARSAPEAIRRLTAALELRGVAGTRNATLDRISLAEAHLIDHDLSQALAASSQALFLAEHSASRRVRKRLSELHQQLGEHRRNPDTSETMNQISELLGQKGRQARPN
jgi:transcriptional regulator with XRE-family HTH domain